MKVGCHVSISGGIQYAFERADSLGCESFQIFTQNQRQWKSVEYDKDTIQKFHLERTQHHFNKIPLIAHASYLINLCAQEPEKLEKSRMAFLEELKRCDQLGIAGLVIHPGAHGGKGEDWGIAVIAESINYALDNYNPQVQILLETTAGQGSSLGYRFENLAKLINMIEKKDRIGVCLDTCHIFAAGYDIRTRQAYEKTKKEFDRIIGINNLFVIHLNDSKKELGSKIDRHEHIGKGCIGIQAFLYIVNDPDFCHIPGIIETPKGKDINGKDMYATDINKLKALINK